MLGLLGFIFIFSWLLLGLLCFFLAIVIEIKVYKASPADVYELWFEDKWGIFMICLWPVIIGMYVIWAVMEWIWKGCCWLGRKVLRNGEE